MNIQCPRCSAQRPAIVRDGHFRRADDSAYIQRYQCKQCSKKFSSATFCPTYRQKKRRINAAIRRLFASSVCQRDIAEAVGVHVNTIAARLRWQGSQSRLKNKQWLTKYLERCGPIKVVQFDDLVTFEHTKCKPLSVPVAVVDGLRIPLGFAVAQIPASGHLAAISRKKYGARADNSVVARLKLMHELRLLLPSQVHFKTDEHGHYPHLIRQVFPEATHERHKSARGVITAQGELKRKAFDPLFSINHTFATMRAKINRLVRKTWCTTKDPERLVDHIDIFIDVFCERLKIPQMLSDQP